MTITAAYKFPPGCPVTVPTASECTEEQLLELATAAVLSRDDLWALLGSQDHVREICRLLVEWYEPDLRAAKESLGRTTNLLLQELRNGINLARRVEVLDQESTVYRAAIQTLDRREAGEW